MNKGKYWIITLVSLIAILSGCQMNSEQKSQSDKSTISKHSEKKKDKKMTKKEQLAYLKEHETEMTKYIQTQNPKITTVKYDWNSIRTIDVNNGTPQGGGQLVLIFGYANGSDVTNFSLNFTLDDNQIPIINSVGSDNLLNID